MTDADSDLLVGLSLDELQALAEGMLAPTAQSQLEALLARHTEHQLSAGEEAILDRLLSQIDQLNILKTRARYTLQQLNRASVTV
jgi:hypothetical protein